MQCTDYLPLLSGRLDGTNSDAEEAALREHLTACEHCRTLLAQWETADAALTAAWQSPPQELTSRIMSEVRAQPKRRRLPSRFYGLAAAALATAAMLGFFVGGRFPLFSDKTKDALPPQDARSALYAYYDTEKALSAASDAADLQTNGQPLEDATDALPESSPALKMPPLAGSAQNGLTDGDSGTEDAAARLNSALSAVQAPVLLLTDAAPSDFAVLDGLTGTTLALPLPLSDDASDETLLALLQGLLDGPSEPAGDELMAQQGQQSYALTVYTVTREVYDELLGCCEGDYAFYAADPGGTDAADDCLIIFALPYDGVIAEPHTAD